MDDDMTDIADDDEVADVVVVVVVVVVAGLFVEYAAAAAAAAVETGAMMLWYDMLSALLFFVVHERVEREWERDRNLQYFFFEASWSKILTAGDVTAAASYHFLNFEIFKSSFHW
jgi:hypothetical protein